MINLVDQGSLVGHFFAPSQVDLVVVIIGLWAAQMCPTAVEVVNANQDVEKSLKVWSIHAGMVNNTISSIQNIHRNVALEESSGPSVEVTFMQIVFNCILLINY